MTSPHSRPSARRAATIRAGGAGSGSVVILLAVVALCLLAGGSAHAGGPVAHAEGGPDVSHLRDRGWIVPGVLPRRLKLFMAEEHRRDGTPVTGDEEAAYIHLGYTDGTSVVSVFIQKGQLDAARLVNWHVRERFGHTIWVQGPEGKNAIWSSGDYVYTVFADASADVVDSVVAALPHESESGFWERLTRGVDRVIAWANPFG
ncbi:hypothetical protein AB0K60_22735 [Thermopolyspora sp. NPDC052614]|uniref:hypothetical protein n=1 Tax=Thermopolyspora sp. NPDC052614 TaxID=3155682 RepID=UPI003420F173